MTASSSNHQGARRSGEDRAITGLHERNGKLTGRGPSRLVLATSLLFTLLSGGACKPGLPPEPPGKDPSDPGAASSPATVSFDPYRTSAFEGQQLDGGGHDHHHHRSGGDAAPEAKHDATEHGRVGTGQGTSGLAAGALDHSDEVEASPKRSHVVAAAGSEVQ